MFIARFDALSNAPPRSSSTHASAAQPSKSGLGADIPIIPSFLPGRRPAAVRSARAVSPKGSKQNVVIVGFRQRGKTTKIKISSTTRHHSHFSPMLSSFSSSSHQLFTRTDSGDEFANPESPTASTYTGHDADNDMHGLNNARVGGMGNVAVVVQRLQQPRSRVSFAPASKDWDGLTTSSFVLDALVTRYFVRQLEYALSRLLYSAPRRFRKH